MVRMENIAVSFSGRALFSGLDWRIGDTDRVGLVGANGSGKTTILRLLQGDVHPDTGTVTSSKGTTFGYLPQEELTLAGRSLFDEVMSVFAEVAAVENGMRSLEARMQSIPSEGAEHDRVMTEYAALQHEFDALDGFRVDARAAEVLAGLGFQEDDRDRMTEEFSGGWQMRIALAKLLLGRPNVLLLDEPTNHLDLESIVWLEEYLGTYPGAVVLVSHDRSFLDRVVSRITEIGPEGLVDYHGGYTAYREQREKRRRTLLATRRQQERRVAHLQKFVDKFRGDKAKTALVRSRLKMIERIELVEVPRETRGIHFEFPQPPRSGALAVSLKGVRQAYGERTVFEDVNLEVSRGDRVAFVGLNGAGKSTLLKIIAGRVPIEAGERSIGHNVTLQYFAQDPGRELDVSKTVIGELESTASSEMRPRLRGLLGAFLFRGDDIEKKVGVLSGGEKSRLVFAKMLLKPGNLLLLDEPTNHLDLSAREVLEDALVGFGGTICFVSHDRSFMDRLATKVLEVRGGGVRLYHGDYSDYLWTKEREASEAAGERKPGTGKAGGRSRSPSGGRKSREQKRREARERQRHSARKQARRTERREVVDEIASLEARLEEIEIALADSAVYRDGDRAKALVTEQRKSRSRVDELYERWAALED